MLDDDGRRLGETANERECGIEVEIIIVGEFFAVELAGGEQTDADFAGRGVDGGFLVGVFAVAEHRLAVEGAGDRFRERVVACALGPEVFGDREVVRRRACEGFGRESPAQVERRSAMFGDLVEHFRVLVGPCDDRDEGMVLGRRSNQTRAPDVDLFDGIFPRGVRLSDRRLEGIKIDDDQFERLPAGCLEACQIVGIVMPAQHPAEDAGMERLDAATHHFGKPGVRGDRPYGDAGLREVAASAAGAVNLHAQIGEAPNESGKAELVADADDRPPNRRAVLGVHDRTTSSGFRPC